MRNDVKDQLDRIMDFWVRMKDEAYGGFYCRMDYNLNIDKTADKSGVAAARNLWSFSRAYSVTGNSKHLECAEHAYNFLESCFFDRNFGGAFWLADYQGRIIDERKHVYLQSFCIYALSEYFRINPEDKVLARARELWRLIESRGYSESRNAYLEEFTREWIEADNELLSENGIIADITTNTHLHVLEAYTNLYKISPADDIRQSLERLVELFYSNIYSKDMHYNKVFFNREWKEVIDLKSFGHDIEASWLLDEAVKALGCKNPAWDEMIIKIAYRILETAVQPDGSMVNESESGIIDDTRIWWVQAEAAVGFCNAWQKTGDDKFKKAMEDIWAYIAANVVDLREGGEWLYGRDAGGISLNRDLVELWKTPYHNARCCIELYERLNN